MPTREFSFDLALGVQPVGSGPEPGKLVSPVSPPGPAKSPLFPARARLVIFLRNLVQKELLSIGSKSGHRQRETILLACPFVQQAPLREAPELGQSLRRATPKVRTVPPSHCSLICEPLLPNLNAKTRPGCERLCLGAEEGQHQADRGSAAAAADVGQDRALLGHACL
jgi:hypothetical protein